MADQSGPGGHPHVSRRIVTKGVALGALIFTVDGVEVALTPREARAADVPLQVLTPQERETLEAIGDVLLPGAREAGLAYFIDHQLSVPPGECLLAVRVTDTPAPYTGLYRGALAAIEAAAQKSSSTRFAMLGADKQIAFVKAMTDASPEGWQGPPARGVYAMLRGDSLDVVYGTPEGFNRVGVPYMPHILPETKW